MHRSLRIVSDALLPQLADGRGEEKSERVVPWHDGGVVRDRSLMRAESNERVDRVECHAYAVSRSRIGFLAPLRTAPSRRLLRDLLRTPCRRLLPFRRLRLATCLLLRRARL